MNRAIGTVVILIIGALVLPAIATAAVPALISTLVLLALLRVAWPPSRHRR